MPVAAYYAWDHLGRPLEPAQHIREFVEAMRAAFPAAAEQGQFSWYADEAHYQAVPAEDHTPYSQTGWPAVSPQWWVFATDVMHRPDLGVDIAVLGAYWVAQARAGRMPWLKYMIWANSIYDVRNGWEPQWNDDDPGHIHLSGRTDYQYIGLGGWSVVPPPAPSTPPIPMKDEDDMRITPLCIFQQDEDRDADGGVKSGIFYAWIDGGQIFWANTHVGTGAFSMLAKQGWDTDTVIHVEDMRKVGQQAD